MRIGIDARFLTHPQKGGFKTYTDNLIDALAKVDTNNEYILYIDRTPRNDEKLPNPDNFIYKVIPGDIPYFGMPWREQVGLSRQIRKDGLDLFHSPCLTAPLTLSCACVITIHDMIWQFPRKYMKSNPIPIQRKIMSWYYRVVPKLAAHRAKAIITVSKAAKDDIIRYLNISPEKIIVTHEAASHIFQKIDDPKLLETVRLKYGLGSKFILAIGSADPRKNIKSLIDAYAILPKELHERYQLAIIWTHKRLSDEVAEKARKIGLDQHIKFLMDVPDDDLALLYNATSLFVFPSHYEGFGLPPLEAMACGTPVVVSDNSSLPEIMGEAAFFVDANDFRSIGNAIAKLLTDETARLCLASAGILQASGFSWIKCAELTVEVYRQAVGMK